MLTRKGESSGDLNPEQPGNQGVVRMGERIFLRKEPPIGYPLSSAQLPHHLHTGNIVHTEKVLFMCLGVYICIYVTTIKEREATDLRESKRGAWVGLEEEKRRGNDGCNSNFKKIKKSLYKRKKGETQAPEEK